MNRKFFTFFAIVIATVLFPMDVMARGRRVRGPDPMRSTMSHSVLIVIEPAPAPIVVVQPCTYPMNRVGFTFLVGTLSQTNMTSMFGPTLISSLEMCVERRSYANWAPVRAGFDISFGVNNFENGWFTNIGFGLRYQVPIVEKFDLGFYLKYNFITNLTEVTEDHHGLIGGILAEFQPLYNGPEQFLGSGLFFTVRAGLGADSYNGTGQTRFIAEFLLGAGYRFADF